tara:strand:+ start:751 stop:888 length:138 start_codon:yes stop_codon:yes gene_type:complete
MSNKNTEHHKRMRAMLAKLNEKQLFRAALKAGKLEFVVVGRKAQS